MKEKRLVPMKRFSGYTSNWSKDKLENLASFSKGKGYSKKDLTDTGHQLILYGRLYTKYETIVQSVDTYTIKQENSLLSKGEEVIVPSSGETKEDIARASAILEPNIIIGGDLNVIVPSKELDSVFLALNISNGYCQSELMKRAQGSSVVHLYNEDLISVTLHFPSIKEQQKIGEFFKVLDERIANQERKIAKVKSLKDAYLTEMFPQEGETVPKRRFKGFEEEWVNKQIHEIADRYDNARIPVTESQRVAGNTPYYGANGIQDYVEGYTHDDENVLLAEDGANDLKDYPVYYCKGQIWVNNHAHVLKGKSEILSNLFLSYLLKSIDMTSYLVGGGRAKLNSDAMMSMISSIPTYLEQQKIGAFFKNLDNQIEMEEKKLDKLQKMKEAYLEEMFV